MRFSHREIKEIAISTLVIGFCFAWVERNSLPFAYMNFLTTFGIMSFAVGSAFVLHEIAHKLTAQNFGCYAEYRMWEWGLIIAFFLAVSIGMVFAAPGAVYIAPGFFGLTRRQEIVISSAGIITNLALAILFSLLAGFTSGYIKIGFSVAAMVNSWIALFNLLPFPPLDGSKIMRWNFSLWLLLAIVALLIWLNV